LLPLEIHLPIVSRIKIMSNLKIDELRIPQDGRFRSIIDERVVDFRVSTFPTSHGEKVAIRILDSTTGLLSIQQLGMSDVATNTIKEAIKKPYGMILITGPTGSGKTTTLYAMLQLLNKDGVNLVTLEDPVEYTLEGVNQSQVLPEIGYTFAKGLRHIVRQDPDIIMVGEVRDTETAELAVHAALTGHLVLSTLHTNNAAGVIPRLIDLGVQKFLLPSSINIMIAQRLVRRLCPHCKKEKVLSAKETQKIDDILSGLKPEDLAKYNIKKPYKIYESVGCEECNNRGFKGRVGIYEILLMNKEIEEIIHSNFSESKLSFAMQNQGMLTLSQDGISKVLMGLTTLEEVLEETER
jgi:type II secretory ATPase GspE/PulE/Tfp pilus assembly ATPase PilB-like protein